MAENSELTKEKLIGFGILIVLAIVVLAGLSLAFKVIFWLLPLLILAGVFLAIRHLTGRGKKQAAVQPESENSGLQSGRNQAGTQQAAAPAPENGADELLKRLLGLFARVQSQPDVFPPELLGQFDTIIQKLGKLVIEIFDQDEKTPNLGRLAHDVRQYAGKYLDEIVEKFSSLSSEQRKENLADLKKMLADLQKKIDSVFQASGEAVALDFRVLLRFLEERGFQKAESHFAAGKVAGAKNGCREPLKK